LDLMVITTIIRITTMDITVITATEAGAFTIT
jgi:hypothetical protein